MRWRLAYKGSPVANGFADRHYSTRVRRAARRALGKPPKQVGAPGRILVLVTQDERAFWISREQDRAACKHAWPGAWECSAFRNESDHRASELVEEAVAATVYAWGPVPPEGFITLVDAAEVRPKKDPGHCFVIAGFRPVGFTKGGHGRKVCRVLKLKPSRIPAPHAALGAQGVLVA